MAKTLIALKIHSIKWSNLSTSDMCVIVCVCVFWLNSKSMLRAARKQVGSSTICKKPDSVRCGHQGLSCFKALLAKVNPIINQLQLSNRKTAQILPEMGDDMIPNLGRPIKATFPPGDPYASKFQEPCPDPAGGGKANDKPPLRGYQALIILK